MQPGKILYMLFGIVREPEGKPQRDGGEECQFFKAVTIKFLPSEKDSLIN